MGVALATNRHYEVLNQKCENNIHLALNLYHPASKVISFS